MRFRTVVAAAFSAMVVAGFAAPARAQMIAVKGGLSLSNIAQDELFSTEDTLKSNTGIMGGVMFVRPLTGAVNLQFEALFVQKGNRLFNDTDFPIDNKIVINYLEVPVMAAIDVMKSGDTTVSVHGGIALGLKMSSTEKNYDEDVEDPTGIKGTDVGVAVGAQVTMGKILFGGRYTLGLTNIRENSDNHYKNRSLTVFAGWILR